MKCTGSLDVFSLIILHVASNCQVLDLVGVLLGSKYTQVVGQRLLSKVATSKVLELPFGSCFVLNDDSDDPLIIYGHLNRISNLALYRSVGLDLQVLAQVLALCEWTC